MLVEATDDGRKTLLSGVAFSTDSFERASVVAVLQATNAFVSGVLEFPTVSRTSQPVRAQTASAAPRDPSPDRRSDATKPSDSSTTPAANDYVSEVLSRIQSTRRSERAPPESS